jgi:ubiquinone/menaquinone biosynthesis C-methylase UbiE
LGKDKATERFDHWSATYEDSFMWRYYFMPLHGTIEQHIGEVEGKDILDVGCGTGDMLRRFARRGAGRLVGADESEGMLSVAREICAGEKSIEFVKASAEKLPMDDSSFDVATSCIAFHHFPDPAGSVAEMLRVLRPGGKLFICDLTDERILGRLMLQYGKLMRADSHYFDADSLSGLFGEAGFDQIVAGNIRFFPPTMLVTGRK